MHSSFALTKVICDHMGCCFGTIQSCICGFWEFTDLNVYQAVFGLQRSSHVTITVNTSSRPCQWLKITRVLVDVLLGMQVKQCLNSVSQFSWSFGTSAECLINCKACSGDLLTLVGFLLLAILQI